MRPSLNCLTTLVDQGVEVLSTRSRTPCFFWSSGFAKNKFSLPKSSATYRSIMNHTTGMHEVPLGSYIIFLDQPQRQNVLTLFEPQIYPNRIDGQGQAEQPYDVAGWTLPMQMGVEAPAVMAIQEAKADRLLVLIRDTNEVRKALALPLQTGALSPITNPLKNEVRIALYKPWTSNMDEGWTRFVFDTFNVPYSSLTRQRLSSGRSLVPVRCDRDAVSTCPGNH